MISVVQLGTIAYAEGLRLQQKLVGLRKAGQIGDVLLLLEHTPVITLGRNAKAANVLVSTEQLGARGVEVFECDRGGDVTFHGPGQIVGYPIFDLRGFDRCQVSGLRSQEDRSQFPVLSSRKSSSQLQAPSSQEGRSQVSGVRSQENADESKEASSFARRGTLGAVDYVRRLEEVLIRTCMDFGIATKRVAGLTGVWTETEPSGKIAAIGVHISRSVTSHGFALNVNTDLSYFNLIVPCGIAARPVTSMKKELGRKVDMEKVAESISRNFGIVFERQMLWVESMATLLGQTVGVPMKAPEELRQMRREDELFLA
jgi:lipoyl(octanoyl) transferase